MKNADNNTKTRRPPPDFNSRRMRIKLFVGAAVMMGVLYLVTEVWFGPRRERGETVATRPVNTRLMREGEATTAQQVTIAGPAEKKRAAATNPVEVALDDAWSTLLVELSRDQHDLIAKVLLQVSQKKTLPAEDVPAWQKFVTQVQEHGRRYEEKARLSLTEANRDEWQKVIAALATAWDADAALLTKLGEPASGDWPKEELARLDRWRTRWETFTLAAVEDDSVLLPKEGPAWFRLLHQMQTTPDIAAAQAVPVTFAQLFQQSADYRGRIVRMNGRVLQAKAIEHPRNVYGIERGFLLWMQPEDSPTTPVMVYALELPPGFPALTKADGEEGSSYVRMREDVRVVGTYFKRRAYLGQDGTYTAPVIIAKMPTRVGNNDFLAAREMPSLQAWIGWIVGCAVLSIIVAGGVYWSSNRRTQVRAMVENSPYEKEQLAESLAGAEVGPTVEQVMQDLEKRAGRAESGDQL